MSKDKAAEYPIVEINNKRYLLDFSDIDGIEWREIKRKIGLSASATITAAASLDFEALAAVAWVIANREEDFEFEDILRGLKMSSIVQDDEVEEVDTDNPKD